MQAFGLDADAMLPRTDETAVLPRQQLTPRVVHADQTHQVALPGRYRVGKGKVGPYLLVFTKLLRSAFGPEKPNAPHAT